MYAFGLFTETYFCRSIKNLSRGSKVYLPVHVDGAKFSVGDLHFSRKTTFTPLFILYLPAFCSCD